MLTNVTHIAGGDQTASQVLLDGTESPVVPSLKAMRNVPQVQTQQNMKSTPDYGGGTGGPPDKDLSMYSQSEVKTI
jgi:hypothetical protein